MLGRSNSHKARNPTGIIGMSETKFSEAFKEITDLLLQMDKISDASTERGVLRKVAQWIFNKFIAGSIVAGSLVYGIAVFSKFQLTQSAYSTALTLISIGYLSILISVMLVTMDNGFSLFKFVKAPVNVIYDRLQKGTKEFDSIFEALTKFELTALKRVNLFVDDERKAFERRVGAIAGAVEKVGFIPGLLTLYFAWVKAIKDSGQEPSQLVWLAGITFVIYLFALYCHHLFSRMDKHIAVLALIIEQKEAEEKDAKSVTNKSV